MAWVKPAAVDFCKDRSLNVGGQGISDHQRAGCVRMRDMLLYILKIAWAWLFTPDHLRNEDILNIRGKFTLVQTLLLNPPNPVGENIQAAMRCQRPA